LQEPGFDLTVHQSKSLDDLPDVEFDSAVTMGCGDECPLLKAGHWDDWGIPDPREQPLEEFRKIRNLIGDKVRPCSAASSSTKASYGRI
jgi:protein-tyrosine-phosphatase